MGTANSILDNDTIYIGSCGKRNNYEAHDKHTWWGTDGESRVSLIYLCPGSREFGTPHDGSCYGECGLPGCEGR